MLVMFDVVLVLFFFFKQKTAYEMRISDWSSDVCSSDLPGVIAGALSIVTYGMALWAFSLGPTAPLAALRETGMVTALAISVLFLGERVTPGRIDRKSTRLNSSH